VRQLHELTRHAVPLAHPPWTSRKLALDTESHADFDHIARNRELWDRQAPDYVAAGERAWASDHPYWGIFGIPESALQLLPEDLRALRAVELGCGTGYVSAWMTRRGASVTGIDQSTRQLETAQRLQRQHRVPFELVMGDCEALPFADAQFDFAISEYGAAIWCRPERWLREAHRVIKPGGALHFLGCSPWVRVCSPVSGALPLVEHLEFPYFDQYRNDWGHEGVEFNLPVSGWFRVFRDIGWRVVDYLEPRPSAPGVERRHYATLDWGYRYPAEQVWKLIRI
jgi:SAM-dependent methyltransferase